VKTNDDHHIDPSDVYTDDVHTPKRTYSLYPFKEYKGTPYVYPFNEYNTRVQSIWIFGG
jgi:hypothetical protein